MFTTSVSLLERLRRPDEAAAWERFVQLYTPLLLHWARRAGLSSEDAADICQDVFATLVQQLPQFAYQPEQRFRCWLRSVLMNKWRNGLRRKALAPALANSAELSGVMVEDGLESFWEEEHRQHLVKRALQLMQSDFEPKTWQACWELVARGRSGADVAAELGISENAAYIAKWRVLRRLREELAGLLD
jgi:RNA polymerase sigma-70 factor (ECF subfamily)